MNCLNNVMDRVGYHISILQLRYSFEVSIGVYQSEKVVLEFPISDFCFLYQRSKYSKHDQA